MRSLVISLTLLLCVIHASSAFAEDFPFLEVSFEDAMKDAQAKKQPILVKAYTTWCGPCKRMDKTVFNTSEMMKIAPRFVAIKVDGDSEYGKVFNAKHGVSRYPTTLFFNTQGKEVHRIIGPRQLDAFMNLMDAHLKGTLRPDGLAPELTASQIALRTAFQQAVDDPSQAESSLENLSKVVSGGTDEEKAMVLYLRGAWVQSGTAGQEKAAIKTLRSNISQYPRTTGAELSLLPLAQSFNEAGQYKKGLDVLLTDLKRAPETSTLTSAMRLATYVLHSGEKPSNTVSKALKKACETTENPRLGPLLATCAELEHRRGKQKEAETYIKRAVALHPEHPWYRDKLEEISEKTP